MARSTNWLLAAQHSSSESQRRKFMRRHQTEYLRSTIRDCRECPLNRTRKNAVPIDGTPPKPIAIIGEAPGTNDDKAGKPLAGRSGVLLKEMLKNIGYERSQAVTMNMVACRPPKDRRPDIEEVEACAPHFDAQLSVSGAWVVVLLGQGALDRIRPGMRVEAAHGKPFWQEGRIWIPTYHLTKVSRSRSLRVIVENDIQIAFDIAYGRNWKQPLSVESLSKGNGKALASAIDANGYVVVSSDRLDDTVVVVKDPFVKVPAKHSSLIRYTVEELVRIGELGRGEDMTTDNLRKIHLVKSLGGTIIQ